MRISECDVLILPGLNNSGDDHWQSRWESRLGSASRVLQEDWNNPDPSGWVDQLEKAVASATRPVVLVAHSLGVLTVAQAAPRLGGERIIGAFLVAPPDPEQAGDVPEPIAAFSPVPTAPLPFPSLLVASRNDPYCSFERAQEIALDWGSALVDAGEAGHINSDSGHGPWPEGLMRLGAFLGKLSKAA